MPRKPETKQEMAAGRAVVRRRGLSKQTKTEMAVGKKQAKVMAREQRAFTKLREKLGWNRAADLSVQPPGLAPLDHDVLIPADVQRTIDRGNSFFVDGVFTPPTKFNFEFSVVGLKTDIHNDERYNAICDGINESIRIVLAQHKLRPERGGRVIINGRPT